MQTAVEWLVINYLGLSDEYNTMTLEETVKQAKEMEKQQILDAFEEGSSDGYDGWGSTNKEKYYNETYGSNETKILNDMKHKLNDYNPFSNNGINESEEYKQIDQNNPVTRGSTALVKVTSSQIEQKQSELIDILKEQVTQLSAMSKIELGDDVIFAIRDLQNEIENLLQNQVKHSTNTLSTQ